MYSYHRNIDQEVPTATAPTPWSPNAWKDGQAQTPYIDIVDGVFGPTVAPQKKESLEDEARRYKEMLRATAAYEKAAALTEGAPRRDGSTISTSNPAAFVAPSVAPSGVAPALRNHGPQERGPGGQRHRVEKVRGGVPLAATVSVTVNQEDGAGVYRGKKRGLSRSLFGNNGWRGYGTTNSMKGYSSIDSLHAVPEASGIDFEDLPLDSSVPDTAHSVDVICNPAKCCSVS